MKKIRLRGNRYQDTVWLEPEDNYWILKTTSPIALEYMRIIGDEGNGIIAFDPSGGPFTAVGDKIENYTVTALHWKPGEELKIYLQEDETDK